MGFHCTPFSYDYLCVIYGWDDKCKMSDAWIAQMRVEQYPPGRNQPFYNVMANDGSNRYAGQGMSEVVHYGRVYLQSRK